MTPPTLDYLQSLITDQVEENSLLEYKSAGAFGKNGDKKLGITKQISAMANAGGGRIIYGIKEFDDKGRQHLPEKIDPINQADYSREWLDQIASLVRPKVNGLKIYPVHVGPGSNDYCFVIDVPQGATAHQATDCKYYRRRNFEALPMEDYEIRDIMNRVNHPTLNAEISYHDRGPIKDSHIVVRVKNSSNIMARHYAIIVHFPISVSSENIHPEGAIIGQDLDGISYWRFTFTNALGSPLFPDNSRIHKVKFDTGVYFKDDPVGSISDIQITVFADNAPKLVLEKNLIEAKLGWT